MSVPACDEVRNFTALRQSKYGLLVPELSPRSPGRGVHRAKPALAQEPRRQAGSFGRKQHAAMAGGDHDVVRKARQAGFGDGNRAVVVVVEMAEDVAQATGEASGDDTDFGRAIPAFEPAFQQVGRKTQRCRSPGLPAHAPHRAASPQRGAKADHAPDRQ